MASSQLHFWRFVLPWFLALLLAGQLGAAPAPWDWSDDAEWQLRSGTGSTPPAYGLGQTLEDPGPQEMIILPGGLLIRHRQRRIVNLTVLEGSWTLLRQGTAVASVGEPWSELLSRWGPAHRIYSHPGKIGVIHYYRAAMADLGVVVAQGGVQSIMLVEPGFLEGALERTGYTAAPP